MSTEVSKKQEVKVSRRADKLEEVLDHGLAGTIAYSGGEFSGFSLKVGNVDFLLTVKAHFPAGHRVCHVGASSLVEVFLKCYRLAVANELVWNQDKYKND